MPVCRLDLALRTLAAVILALAYCAACAQDISNTITGIVNERVGSEVSRGQSESVYGRLVKLNLSVEATKGQLKSAKYQSYSHTLLQHFVNGALIVWDFDQGGQVDEFLLPGAAIPIHYDPTTAAVYVISDSKFVRINRTANAGPVSHVLLDQGARAATTSGNGRWMFIGTDSGEVIKMSAEGKIAWRKKTSSAGIRELISNDDGTHLTALGDAGELTALDEASSTRLPLFNVARLFGYDQTKPQINLLSAREVVSMSLQGEVLKRVSFDTGLEAIAPNAQGDRILAISGGRLSLGSGSQWTPIDVRVRYAVFLDNKRYLYVQDNGITYLRSLDVSHYLLSIVPGASGWVIVDHQGRYDGTVDGTKDVTWKAGTEALSLDKFFDTYYQPGLLAKYIRAQDGDLPKLPTDFKGGVYLAPKVELDFPDGVMKPGKQFRVVAVAESRGGKLSEDIRFFHNGKRLPAKARIGSQTSAKDGKLLLVQVFAFVPSAGLNEVYAESSNLHGLIGRSEVKKVLTEGFRPSGKLHIVGIGIDKYRDSSLNLNYALTDVSTVLQRLQNGAKGYYDGVLTKKLADEGATRTNIKTALDSLEQAGPDDSVIVLLAGHGDTSGDEWYFLPHDVNADALRSTAVSAKEIQDALVKSPATRILLIVDACNSGAGIDSFNTYRNFQKRFAQEMGRSAGVAVLTAARRDQFALEIKTIGHGLFTYTLLEGLAGAADVAPQDKKVSAHEIAVYVADHLRSKALEFSGNRRLRQDPAHFVIGSDFLIADVAR